MPYRRSCPAGRASLAASCIAAMGIIAALSAARPPAGPIRPETPGVDVSALEREAEAHPDEPERLLSIGERLRRAGESARSFEIIARAYDQRFKEPRFAAAMVEALLAAGQVQDAYALGGGLLAAAPESAEVSAAMADVWLRLGRYSRGLTLARKAVRLAPRSPRAWRAFAHGCALEQRLEEAWPAFDRALALAPDDGGLLADYGDALSRYGRAAEAGPVLRGAAALCPRDPRVLTMLGAHLGRQARTPSLREEALTLLRRAVSLAATATEPRYQLGKLLLDGGNAAGAARELEESLRLDPSLGEAWLPLAQSYQALGSASRARDAFAAYQRYSDYRRESAHLEVRLRRTPRSLPLLLRMARLQENHGRLDRALGFYRDALRLRSDRELAAYALLLEHQLRAQAAGP